MTTDPIDKISVEIETTANGAEKGVGDLVRVLESLNNVLDRIAGTGAAKSIREVGRAASKAGSETSVAKKQRVLSKAKETITGRADNESRDEEYRRVNEARRARTKEVFRKRDAGEYPSVPYSRKANAAAGEALENVKKFLADTTGTKKFDYEKYLAEAEERIDTGGLKEKISEATSIIDNYKAKIRELKEEFSGLDDTGIKKLVEGDFLKSANDIENLISSVRKLETLASNRETTLRLIDSGELHATQEEVDSLASSLTSVKDRVIQAGAAADESMNRVSSSVENARQRVDEFKESLFANRTIWDVIKSSASSALDDVKTKLAEAAAQSEKWASTLKYGIPIIGTLASVLSSTLRGGLTLLGKLWSGFKRLASTIAGAVVGGLQKLGSMLKTVGGSVLNYVTKPFQRAISVIQKWKKTLGRLVFLRVVRSAIKMVTDGFKEGIENLYYFSSLVGTQFAPAMDRLATSSLYLKNSLGAMAGPLIQAVAPIVDMLVDKFVQLLNAVNMVFAALGGGGTYTKAIKNAAQYGDKLNDAMGGAAESAKEFKRYLIGIDELNVIPEQTTPGGASGSGAGLDKDYASMFEQAPLPDWVKSIKDAINAGDWYGAGELLADKVNTLIDKLKKNAPTWGSKIGQAIQNGIEFSLGFIRRLNIEDLGASVATIIGNALNKIKPADLGAIIASGIKSAFRFAHGFLRGYTGPEIGTYLSGVVNGWFAELRRDSGWQKAAEDLSQAIKGIINGVTNFLKGLDVTSITNDLRTFFGGIDWVGIWESMKNLAKTAADVIPWKDMLNGLLTFAANALVFVREQILGIPSSEASDTWQELEGKLETAGYSITWIDILSGISAFLADVTDKITGLIPGEGWGTIWDSVKQNIATALGASNWEDLKRQLRERVVSVLSEAFKMAMDALYQSISAKYPNLAAIFFPERAAVDTAARDFKNTLSKWNSDISADEIEFRVQMGLSTQQEALDAVGQLTGVYYNSYGDMLDAVRAGLVQPVLDGTSGLSGDVKSSGNDIASGILEGAEQQIKNDEKSWRDWAIWPWNWFKEENEIASPSKKFALLGGYMVEGLYQGASESWDTITGFFSDSLLKLNEIISEGWSAIESGTVSTWDAVSGLLGDTWAEVKSEASQTWSNIKATVGNAWDQMTKDTNSDTSTIKSTVSSAWENVKSTIISKFSTAKETSTTAWNSLKQTVSTITENIKTNVSNGFSSAQNSISTTMQNATSTAANAWSNISSNTAYANSGISSNVSSTWSNIYSSVSSSAQNASNTASNYWGNISRSVSSSNSSISSNVSSAWNGAYNTVSNSLSNISWSVSNTFSSIVSRAWSWGSDLCANIANGINYAINWVSTAASNVADAIKSYLGFSEPEKGPLSNFHTYMPDMLKSMADGIRSNQGIVISAVSELAGNVSKNLSIVAEANAMGYDLAGELSYSVAGPDASEISAAYDGMADGNDDVINAINAIGARLSSALAELSKRPVVMNGRKVSEETTSQQNRMNRMYGRTLQNV